MSTLLKTAAALTILLGLSACTVVPAQVGYAGPDVAVVTVRPAPYYGPRPYYYGPRPYYYGPPRHGDGPRHGHRHW